VAALLGEYLDEWLKVIRPDVSVRTFDSYKSLIETHVKPALGWKRLASLSALDLDSLYSSLKGKKSRRTIAYIHTVVNAALRQAVRWKLIHYNPASDTDPRTRKPGREIKIHPLTEPELAVFLDHAQADPFYAVLLVAVSSGLRPEEYLALQWRHFDAGAATLRVERVLVRENGEWVFRPPKTEKSYRTVPIPKIAVDALTAHKREQNKLKLATKVYASHNLVFADGAGGPLDVNNVRRRQFHKVLTSAKLDQRRLYDLRHTWVTLSLAAGADVKAVSEWAGHSSVAFTLDTYAHLIPSTVSKNSATIAALFS
jgi:integrase